MAESPLCAPLSEFASAGVTANPSNSTQRSEDNGVHGNTRWHDHARKSPPLHCSVDGGKSRRRDGTAAGDASSWDASDAGTASARQESLKRCAVSTAACQTGSALSPCGQSDTRAPLQARGEATSAQERTSMTLCSQYSASAPDVDAASVVLRDPAVCAAIPTPFCDLGNVDDEDDDVTAVQTTNPAGRGRSDERRHQSSRPRRALPVATRAPPPSLPKCRVKRGLRTFSLLQTVQFDSPELEETFVQYFLPQKLVDLIQASLLLIAIHFGMQVTLWTRLPEHTPYLDSRLRYNSLLGDGLIAGFLAIAIIVCVCMGLRSLMGPSPYMAMGCKLYSATMMVVMVIDSFLMPLHAFCQPFTPTTALWFVVVVVLTINTKSTFSPGINCLVTVTLATSWILYTCLMADVKEEIAKQAGASFLLLMMSVLLGVGYKLLTERALRNAFVDTTRHMQMAEKLTRETGQQESLLLSIFPDSVAKEMTSEVLCDLEKHFVQHGTDTDTGTDADAVDTELTFLMLTGKPHTQFHRSFMNRCENVSILCADIVSFTETSSTMLPQELVAMLNDVFARFDAICQAEGCDRIKILGDGYVCVAGVPLFCEDHADRCVKTGLRLAADVGTVGLAHGKRLRIRVGIHSGAVLCGVLGLRKWSFDVWGHDVRIASLMESTGKPGLVHVSQDTTDALQSADEFLVTRRPYPVTFNKRQIVTAFITRFPRQDPPTSSVPNVTATVATVAVATNFAESTSLSGTLRSGQHPFADLRPLSFASDGEGEVPLANCDIVTSQSTYIESPVASDSEFDATPSLNTADTKISLATRELDAEVVSATRAAGDVADEETKAMWERFSKQLQERSYLITFFANLNYRTLTFKDKAMTQSYNNMADDTFEINIVIYGFVIMVCITVIRLAVETASVIRAIGWLALTPALLVIVLTILNRLYKPVRKRTGVVLHRIHTSRTIRTVITITAYIVLHAVVELGMVVCKQKSDEPRTARIANCSARVSGNDSISCFLADRREVHVPVSQCSHDNYTGDGTGACGDVTVTNMTSLFTNMTSLFDCNVTSADARGFLPMATKPSENNCKFPHLVTYAEMFAVIGMVVIFRTRFLYMMLVVIALATLSVVWTRTVFKLPHSDAYFYWIRVSNGVDLPVYFGDSIIFLNIIAVLVVLTHSRSMEIMLKINHIWNQEYSKSSRDNKHLRQANLYLLHNILPKHVAKHFLSHKTRTKHLYSCYHENVAVMFCSIPNFTDSFYHESSSNRHGMECLRLLNEIFADWDKLLSRLHFSSVEKIKTIGPTYMLVAGLDEPLATGRHNSAHVLASFARAMFEVMDEINENSFNSFTLRIGLHSGPLVSGVIGARKPLFDIWGDTVNVASRMESTGLSGQVQVTESIGVSLRRLGYKMADRGEILIKGKGMVRTQFISEWPSVMATRSPYHRYESSL